MSFYYTFLSKSPTFVSFYTLDTFFAIRSMQRDCIALYANINLMWTASLENLLQCVDQVEEERIRKVMLLPILNNIFMNNQKLGKKQNFIHISNFSYLVI